MARIGILTLYATGHLSPSLVLARALLAAGHRPVVFNLPDTEAAVRTSGVDFVPYGADAYPAGSLKLTMQRTAELAGPAAFAHYVERMVQFLQPASASFPR